MSDSEIEAKQSMKVPALEQVGETVSDAALVRVATGSVLILLGMLVARACGFLRQFLVIRMLSPASYGLFALSLTIVTIIGTLGSLGLYQGAQRFIAYNMAKDDYAKVKGTIQSSLVMATMASVVVMILAIVFAGPLASFFAKPGLTKIVVIMAPMVPFQIISAMIMAYFLGLHKPAPNMVIQDIGFNAVSVIAILIALLIGRSVYAPAFAMTASALLLLLASLYVFRSRFPLDLKTTRAFPISKSLIVFSLPLLLTASLYIVMQNTDTIVVGHFLSSAQVGFYNAAFLLMGLIPIFLGAVSIIYLPVATSLRAKSAQAESLRLYRSSTRWLFILTVPLFLTFFLFPAQTLSLLFGGRYVVASTALWILSLGAFVNTFLGPNNLALIAYGETGMVLYGSLVAVAIDITLCVLLVPRMGISGAAIGTASALGVSNIMYSFFLWFRHRLHPFERNYIITIVFLFALGVALYKPLRAAINRADFLLLAVYPVFLIVGILFIILTRSISDEDRLLWKLIRDKFRR